MNKTEQSKSQQIRARLNHPIIDSDGHTFELGPLFMDYLKSVAGEQVAGRFATAYHDTFADPRWSSFSVQERRERRNLRPTWWAIPARNTTDLATAIFPKLMYERLPEMGLDFSVVYPTMGLITIQLEDDELRRAAARALNLMKAETFRGLEDRLTPAALIPMHTPAEAIHELEYSVRGLGLKSVMMASYVRRPIPYAAKRWPEAARYTYWMDTFGLDSEYDYDPVWAKCQELGIAPTFHSVGYGWGSRTSVSNYVHNHIGNFAASAEAVCRSLFLGGVPKRFPKLRFAFLEGGMSWARSVYSELIGHWLKRNGDAMQHYNPANIDRAVLSDYARRYGGGIVGERIEQVLDSLINRMGAGYDPNLIDEFAPSGVDSPEAIRDIFTTSFYFGCEGDEPLNALAWNAMGTPFDAKLKALYGSDIGHWDVPDMRECAEEAYELVEDGLIDAEQLREFVFTNAVEFWTAANPDFFKGTAVEDAARACIRA
ncbi:MAG TPA: amidohydrolase family protein [Candidatus Binataceae bacterium]|nr:amidohydrolase family protein [Candidatus Binataceae bacterium]